MLAKKLILNLNIIFGEEMEFSLLLEQIEKPKSGGKEVSVQVKDGLLFATFKATSLQNGNRCGLKNN